MNLLQIIEINARVLAVRTGRDLRDYLHETYFSRIQS